MKPVLSRLPSSPDERDRNFLMSARLGQSTLQHKYWKTGPVLDQGQTPHCVEYAWRQLLASSPVRNKWPYEDGYLYDQSRIADHVTAPEGSSTRGGVTVLHNLGYVPVYVWDYSVEAVANWIIQHGPVVTGTNWYTGMFEPDKGYVRVTGSVEGGHEYVLSGADLVRARLRITNSWGRPWGENGRAWITFEDYEKLLAQQGDACAATEVLV